jgi:hypothetical protein
MIAFGHTAVGVITGIVTYEVATSFGISPVLGLFLSGTVGVVSHYLTDCIPHGHFFKHRDYGAKVKYAIIFDFLLSILFFTYLSYLVFGLSIETFYILFGIGGAQLPDVLDGLFYIKKLKTNPLLQLEIDFHQSTHWHGKLDKALLLSGRDIWQVLTVLLAIIILIYR